VRLPLGRLGAPRGYAQPALDISHPRFSPRFNEVAALMQALESLPNGNPLEDHPAYRVVKDRGYLRVPHIVQITPPEPTTQLGDADFSPEAIKERAQKGKEQTEKALKEAWLQ
jgi:hypothetical protein